MQTKWHEQTGAIYWYDQYALNEAKTAFARYDPDRIVKELLFVNADIYAIYAANQFNLAYYPSKVIPQHPGLRGRDYVGEIVPRLRAKGKRVILYANWLDSKHPEWCLQRLNEDDTVTSLRKDYPLVSWARPSRKEGKVMKVPGGQWQHPCVNSPKRELTKAITRELAERYAFDAFHLDMFFSPHVCLCRFCQPFLKNIFGKTRISWVDLKRHWPAYLKWKCARHSSLLGELNAILKSRNPNVVAIHNAFCPLVIPAIGGLNETWLPHLDVYLSESFDVFEVPYGDLNVTSLQVKLDRALNKPAAILLTSTPLEFGHAPISAAKFAMYASAAKANGCHIFGPCGIGARQDTTTDWRLLNILRDTFRSWKADPDNYSNLESAARVGLVYSFATRSHYEPGQLPVKFMGEFTGWGRVLVERHVPFNIELAESLDDAAAGKYDVLILPNVACADDRFADIIRRFVASGGNIIATGETSLYDSNGQKRRNFGLADVLGVNFIAPLAQQPFYVEAKPEPIIAGGEAQRVRGEGRTLARLVEADPAGSPCGGMDPLPMAVSPWPLLAKRCQGQGTAWYIAWLPGKFAMDVGYWQTMDWMERVLRTAVRKPIFTTNAPSTVEVMAWHDPQRQALVIKFSNRTVPQMTPTTSYRHTRRDPDEIVPIRGLELVFAAKAAAKVQAECAQSPLRVVQRGREVRVILEQLEAYASVCVRGLS